MDTSMRRKGMARPKRDGLLYFSLDTDFFYADRRIRALRTRFGSDGIVFYLYLLTEIYRAGYCIRWNSDTIESAMDELGFTEGLIEQIMTFLVGRSLLTRISILTDPDTIITSPGIQKRYQEAAKSLRRDVFVDPQTWLLPSEETLPFIKFGINADKSGKNASKSGKNPNKYGKNPGKENILNKNKKEKEVKEKESGKDGKNTSAAKPPTTATQIINERGLPSNIDAAVKDWVKYKTEKRQSYKETGLRNFLAQVENNVSRYGADPVIDLIHYCMSQNWQGVIWDRLHEGKYGPPHDKPSAAPAKNRFSNFDGRNYDYEKMVFDQIKRRGPGNNREEKNESGISNGKTDEGP